MNQLQLGMLGVTLVLLRTGPLNFRDIAVAAWFTLCLAFKPSLVWCVVLVVFDAWLAGRHTQLKRLAIGGFIGTVSAMILSMPWFTIRDWLEWSCSVWNLPDEIIRTEIGNISIAITLIDQGLIPRWLPWLVSLALATLVAVISNCHRQRCGSAGDLSVDETAHTAFILAIGCLIPLLMSRLIWYHYLVLAIPSMLIIISRIENLIRRDRVQAVALTSLVLWSLLLLGIAPVDNYFSADAVERSVRVAFAVAFLLSMTLCFFQIGVSDAT
ncbi:MAG: hypothetical protein R3C59_23895 [Planctomycetaceae bacterium]